MTFTHRHQACIRIAVGLNSTMLFAAIVEDSSHPRKPSRERHVQESKLGRRREGSLWASTRQTRFQGCWHNQTVRIPNGMSGLMPCYLDPVVVLDLAAPLPAGFGPRRRPYPSKTHAEHLPSISSGISHWVVPPISHHRSTQGGVKICICRRLLAHRHPYLQPWGIRWPPTRAKRAGQPHLVDTGCLLEKKKGKGTQERSN